ncbi:uncharacterized protein LOC114945872 isoform X1 [Nylanderia fulva]|uniref:uncharacterized protein LOC114945872 isoform X1 n=1 Tax=Nylanderia fulva TaxID=613905 RepID=UPI0010FBB6B4|nr:uncharacterized protein LOC114945872 isoform X1 [Nylanderia fulva]XP_029178047.1 uncharacterized protein LOC114945872 isoform X1 [Nylanderia fulva]
MDDNQIYSINFEYKEYKNVESSSANIIAIEEIEEKEGDDFLIELYRERKYLYDKSNRDFKNKIIRGNAWVEISNIMQQKNQGQHYTPQYCQTRCTSLRDQYSREKRKDDYKSGNSSKRRTFPFTQLSFLDNFIKRRRNFSNIKKKKNTFVSMKNTSETVTCENNNSTDGSQYEQQDIKNRHYAVKPRGIHPETFYIEDIKNSQKRNSESQDTVDHLFPNNFIKRRRTFSNIRKKKNTHKSVEITSETVTRKNNNSTDKLEYELQDIKDAQKRNSASQDMIDNSFIDYIRVHLQNTPEPEKSIRKKMLFEALVTPLSKIYNI